MNAPTQEWRKEAGGKFLLGKQKSFQGKGQPKMLIKDINAKACENSHKGYGAVVISYMFRVLKSCHEALHELKHMYKYHSFMSLIANIDDVNMNSPN